MLFRYFNRWISGSTSVIQSTFAQLETGNLEARCPAVEVEEFNEIGISVNKVIDKLKEKINGRDAA